VFIIALVVANVQPLRLLAIAVVLARTRLRFDGPGGLTAPALGPTLARIYNLDLDTFRASAAVEAVLAFVG
jgi:hypothetical protein